MIIQKLKDRAKEQIKRLKIPFFRTGDIINLQYFLKFKSMFFKGICIHKKFKLFMYKNSFFILRNVHTKVGLSWQCLYIIIKF